MAIVLTIVAVIFVKKIRKLNFKIRNAKNEMNNVLSAQSTPDIEPSKPVTPYKPF